MPHVGAHQDQPDLVELLRVVREYLETVVDRVPDEYRYHAMCCVYSMSIAERQAGGDGVEATGLERRLRTFIDAALPPADARCELAGRIRSGDCDSRWDETLALVLAQVIHKVRLSKPGHLNAMHREHHGSRENA